MKTLKANVKEVFGRTRHSIGRMGPSGPEELAELPFARSVQIHSDNAGFLLLRFDANGEFCGDTWHCSLEEAKQQALFEFGIVDTEWKTEVDTQGLTDTGMK